MNDLTTFTLSFVSVFGGIAAYAWHLRRLAGSLARRLQALESLTARQKGGQPPAGP